MRKISTILMAVFITFTAFSQSQLDSTIMYDYSDMDNPVNQTKKYNKTYNDNNQLTELVKYEWVNNQWVKTTVQNYEYNLNGDIKAYEEINTNYVGDYKVE